jgi:putative ABC transport system permease protein
MGRIVDIDVQEGSLEDLGDDGVLVHEDPAKDLDLQVGSPLDVTWPNGRQQTLTVKGVYGDASLAGNWVVSIATLEANNTAPPVDIFAGAVLKPDVTPEGGRAAIEAVAVDYPQVRVDDRAEFRDRQEGQIDQSLVVINLLLGLAVVIALIGIANTLALSVFERTRELGLLRAVGMSRRQVRRMVRWESVVVALFGAVLGVVIGAPLGVALCAALPESLVQSIAFPTGQIVVLLLVAVAAGVLAAIFPARRAARMDVLRAISSE